VSLEPRILVAGVGNVFFGDDGFGVEVVRRLRMGPALPSNVKVLDVGIRGIHLAYELMDGCELLVLVDIAARGHRPGTVTVIEADGPTGEQGRLERGTPVLDAHGLAPAELLGALSTLEATPDRTLVVACEPVSLDPGIGLSGPVAGAVDTALGLIADILSAHPFYGTDAEPAEKE
jgi:hydrogenase maturation protease